MAITYLDSAMIELPASIATLSAGTLTTTDLTAQNLTVPGITTTSSTAKLTITDNSSNDAFRITQTGSGNALVVEDSDNPDSTPFIVNSLGQVVVGFSAAPFNDTTSGLHLVSPAGSTPRSNIQVLQVGDTEPTARIRFARARGIINAPTTVLDGDDLGALAWVGHDGTNLIYASHIQTRVDGTPTVNNIPTRILFSTREVGATSMTERMCINNAGNVGIGTTAPNESLTVTGNISATGTASVSALNIVSGNIFPKTTLNNLVSALAINVNGTTLYMPLLSAI